MKNSNDTNTVSGELKDMTKSVFEVNTVELSDSQLALYVISKNGTRFEFRLHWKNVGQGVSTPCVMVWG